MAKTLLKVFNVLADPARIDTGTGSDADLEFWQSIYCIHTCAHVSIPIVSSLE